VNKRIQPQATYRSQFDERITTDWDGVDFVAETFQKIGEYVVVAGEAVQVGFGASSGQHSAEGRVYLDLQDDAADEVNGLVRVEIHNPRDRHRMTVFESRTETLRTSAADRRQQLAFPKVGDAVTTDYKIVITVRPDDAFEYSEDNTNLSMDITIHDVRE